MIRVPFLFALGDSVEDTISGFKGIVTVQIALFNGSKRYTATSTCLDDSGRALEEQFDECRLVSTNNTKDIGIKP